VPSDGTLPYNWRIKAPGFDTVWRPLATTGFKVPLEGVLPNE